MTTSLPFEKIKRQLLVKKESETRPKFGKQPEMRTAEELLNKGIVNIDKPSGPTSHQVSAYVQKILGIKKSGHSGTLDPKVTGLLPIALESGTRIVQALLPAGKEYVGIMHLHRDVDEDKVREVCKKFVGRIKQLPPIKSNVKRVERYRNIYYLKIIEISKKDVLFVAGTQAGTYIRKLVHDIGIAIGTGAHMAELRRTKAGPFSEDTTLITLQDLSDAYYYYREEGSDKYLKKIIMPIENAVAHLPKIWVMDTTVNTLCHGASLKVPGIAKLESDIEIGETVAVMSLKNELISLGIAVMTSKEIVKNNRGLAAKANKVFMEPGTYPVIQKS